MKIDEYGLVGFTQSEVVEYLRVNPNFNLEHLFIIDGQQYEKAHSETYLDVPEISLWNNRDVTQPVEEYHKTLQSVWIMPDEYASLDIQSWLVAKCKTTEQISRVQEELLLYSRLNLLDLLRYLLYLRELAATNNIVWGVGRGSACCSYCLFLMGIHRVDSLKFNLEIQEFLRER